MSCGEKSNAFENLHDVTLQRLDVYHRNNGGYVFYDAKHFAPTADRWNAVPVIYVETGPGEPAEHPQFKDVVTRTLPAKFRTVGSVSAAHLTETGEKVLKGAIAFSDPAIAAKANAGELSLSTGLASPETPDPRLPGATRIAGPVTPNHVLVFDRGACPNCYPNDSGAMFHNLQEPDMPDDETKGLLKRIADALTKTPEPPQQYNNLAEIEGLKKDLAAANAKITEMANLIKPPEQKGDKPDEEKENLKKELADLKAAQAKKDADAAWSAVKVNLPEGWLGEKEGSTRKEFETAPAAFLAKFAEFKNTQPGAKGAEGSGTPPGETPNGDEAQFKNLASEFEKKYGIRVV